MMKGLVEVFEDISKLLKSFKKVAPTPKMFSLIEKNIHGAL
jgi:hypothetical protein